MTEQIASLTVFLAAIHLASKGKRAEAVLCHQLRMAVAR